MSGVDQPKSHVHLFMFLSLSLLLWLLLWQKPMEGTWRSNKHSSTSSTHPRIPLKALGWPKEVQVIIDLLEADGAVWQCLFQVDYSNHISYSQPHKSTLLDSLWATPLAFSPARIPLRACTMKRRTCVGRWVCPAWEHVRMMALQCYQRGENWCGEKWKYTALLCFTVFFSFYVV